MRLLQRYDAHAVERGGYACGVVSARLHRVESMRVEKKIDKADRGNTAVHFHLYGKIHKDESAMYVHRVVASNAICKEAA